MLKSPQKTKMDNIKLTFLFNYLYYISKRGTYQFKYEGLHILSWTREALESKNKNVRTSALASPY